MIHEKIYLNKEKTAYLEVYCLDTKISSKKYKKWPAMIICPGGAYLISATKEGESVAMKYLSEGYSCFVLRYSTFLKDNDQLNEENPKINTNAHYPTQILELMEAIHIIKENADTWGIDKNQIYGVGFSAGSHILGTVSTQWDEKKFTEKLSFVPTKDELKLSGVILSYPMLKGPAENLTNDAIKKQAELMNICLFNKSNPSFEERKELDLINHISSKTTPTFIWITFEDDVTSVMDSIEYVKGLHKNNIICESHFFQKGKHGLARADEHYASDPSDINYPVSEWIKLSFNWLKNL